MKKIIRYTIITSIVIAFFSCKNKEKKVIEKEFISDTSNYYPVNFFLEEDIIDVKHHDYKIYKIFTVGKSLPDSIMIDTTEFNSFANDFLQKDITKASVRRFYKESVFRSLATNSISFNYISINPDLDVRSIDANVNEDDNKLKRVDVRVISSKNDTTYTKNYCWLPGTKFYITQYAKGKDKKGIATTTTISWHKQSNP